MSTTTTRTVTPAVSLNDYVTQEHLDDSRHRVASWSLRDIVVDGDLRVRAFPCECGRWVAAPDGL